MAGNVSDLDEHKSIETLRKEILVLKRENHACLKTIEKLLKDNSRKNEELQHLQSLVSQAVPVIKKEQSIVAPEEEIAGLQLERLRQAAQNRTLTLEETRMFDLLVKNKRLSQEDTAANSTKGNYRDVTDIELLKLAAREVKPSDGSEV